MVRYHPWLKPETFYNTQRAVRLFTLQEKMWFNIISSQISPWVSARRDVEADFRWV